jgi:regulator of protease activity HflC (stomatin/prohibitin superfamily)
MLTNRNLYDIIVISRTHNPWDRIGREGRDAVTRREDPVMRGGVHSQRRRKVMEEKILKVNQNGMLAMFLIILSQLAAIGGMVFTAMKLEEGALYIVLFVICTVYMSLGSILYIGLKVLKPQEALVLTLFGKYIGTLKGDGFYWVNPFVTAVNPAANTRLNQSGDVQSNNTINISGVATSIEMPSKKLSLKVMTLNNTRQKINDCLGNPVEIGIAVTWRIVDTAKAVFNVENYKEFLSLQCDSALRNIVRIYPYDVAQNVDTTGDGQADEGSLRGSSEIVAKRIKEEIQGRVESAGIEIIESRITYLAYAPEIAAAMLQRQQASAIIDARKMIVDGAVGMVELALERLNENNVVNLDEERKAAMVSNLLVVLCGNHDAQPVVNSGSLY